jgi:hypothetical protein
MLIPDVELQQCDGTWVNLHDLVCARGAVVTQAYSYAGWCPGCQGFSGLTDGGFSGNDLYDSYHDDGYEQVIIYSNTSNYGETPTQEDCNELQALHEGLVVFMLPARRQRTSSGYASTPAPRWSTPKACGSSRRRQIRHRTAGSSRYSTSS